MVRGLDLFREHFSGQENKYVIIGGTACEIYLENIGIDFRATKDLDIVLSLNRPTLLSPDYFGTLSKKGNTKTFRKAQAESLQWGYIHY